MDWSLDGKKYGKNDMAPIGCDDCKGCSSCCHEMGDTVILDPYDLWLFASNMRLEGGAKVTFEILVSEDGPWELSVQDGLIMPNIKMVDDGRCPFLLQNGRCGIHKIRSGLCRLFPLGRGFEEDGSITYYVLNSEIGCEKLKGAGSNVAIRDWLEIENLDAYERYQSQWHALKKKMSEHLRHADENECRELNAQFLDAFYYRGYGQDFYSEIDERMSIFDRVLKRYE